MTELIPFDYQNFRVRTLTDLDGEPWFVAADVCAVLGIVNVGNATTRLDAADVRLADISSGTQGRNMRIISEAGLYELIIRSDKPEARPFRRWITTEVLPSIRRTGAYAVDQKPTSQLDILRAALDQIEAAQIAAAEAREIARTSEARLDAIEDRHEWFAALGYARLNGLPTSAIYLQRLGATASRIGRANGINPNKVEHALYGQVNQWPAWVWAAAVDERLA